MIRRAFVCVTLCVSVPSAQAALETLRDVQAATPACDPIAPSGLFWHANPAFAAVGPSHVFAAAARPYGLESLTSGAAGMLLTPGRAACALGIASVGDAALYRELDLSITAGFRAWSGVSAGVSGHLLEIRFGPRFGPLAFGVLDAGAVWSPAPSWFMGASATDLGAPILYGRGVVSARYQAGVSWLYSDRLTLRLGVTEGGGYRHVSFGETLRLSRVLALAADLRTNPMRLGVVATLRLGGLVLSIGYRDHPDLGGDTSASVGWRFDRGSER